MSDGSEERARLRALPSVDRVIAALTGIPHHIAADAARRAVDAARERARRGAPTASLHEIADEARALVAERRRSVLQPVINATGVLIHTNLGRVPLGRAQLDAVAEVAAGYSNLEYDVARGRRGSRYAHAQRLMTELTGAESCLVVNNNAAALLLVLAALCARREVIISRGELIEIGGEFRIPDVMAASGVRLVEVGTTNRTHLSDYESAVTTETAAILKVHPSNYRIEGFTASVPAADLARLARGRGVLLIHDVGSGLVGAPAELPQAATEPPVEVALEHGADLVTFSGDKLFGGPQAGVIVGRAELVARISRHPLLRAVRVDKMTLAALEATAAAYLGGDAGALPLWGMALVAEEELERRARALAARLEESLGERGVKIEAAPSRAVTGGGSLPGKDLGSWAVAVTHSNLGAPEVERALRLGAPPVVARIEDERVLLDLRTVPAAQDEDLERVIVSALG